MEREDGNQDLESTVPVVGRFDSQARQRTGRGIATLVVAAVVCLIIIAGALLLILQNVFVATPK